MNNNTSSPSHPPILQGDVSTENSSPKNPGQQQNIYNLVDLFRN